MAEATEINTFRINGVSAELKWEYHKVATLTGWKVEGKPGAWRLSASLQDVDDYRLSQRPLVIVTPNGWTWRVLELQITDQALTASIGPKE